MGAFIDLTGQRFDRLRVVKRAENIGKNTAWLCECDCGNETIVAAYSLRSGQTRSCGCLQKEFAGNLNRIEMIGKRFGRLIVNKEVCSKKNGCYWECACDCGNTKIVNGTKLRNGSVLSCGCLRREKLIKRNLKHNLSNTRIYSIWHGMKDRCYTKTNSIYKHYGERGICVYDLWLEDFMSFYNWAMESGYNDYLTIERIDVNGNYEPSNCKWIPLKEQSLNRRDTKYVHINGKKESLVKACERIDFSVKLARKRMYCGWTDEFLFKPKGFSYKKYLKEQQKKQQEASAS